MPARPEGAIDAGGDMSKPMQEAKPATEEHKGHDMKDMPDEKKPARPGEEHEDHQMKSDGHSEHDAMQHKH